MSVRILGIESSCDETGVALVETTGAGVPRLRSQALHSQIRMHQAYGGVVPEIAARAHVEVLDQIIARAMREAGKTFQALDGGAVRSCWWGFRSRRCTSSRSTSEPGLVRH